MGHFGGILILLSTFIFPAFAENAKKPLARAKILKCSSPHLKDKSCLFEKRPLSLRVSDTRFSLYNGVWRNLQEFPFPGSDVEWSEVKLTYLKDRVFLEIKVWDKPVGMASIQSLTWTGYELKDLKLEKKWLEVLQKRRRLPPEAKPKERAKGTLPEPEQNRYLYDKKSPEQISLNKAGQLVIHVGSRETVER